MKRQALYMKIKKILKSAGAAAAVFAVPAAINKCIFMLSKNKSDCNGQYYTWQYGNVFYKKTGRGRPLLLIHSLAVGAGSLEFMYNIDELSKKYTVYAVDLPGFGLSDKPKITYTAFIYSSFINSFIKDVIKKPSAVAASNGSGMFAVIAAKLYPKNISKLILVSPAGIASKMAKNDDITKRTFLELPVYGTFAYNIAASKKNIKTFLIKEGFYAPHKVSKEICDAFYHAAHATGGDVRYAYASLATNYMNMDIKQYFKAIVQPVFVIWGEENSVNPIKNMDLLEEMKPESEYFIFEETKLFPHMENPEEFNKIIKEKI